MSHFSSALLQGSQKGKKKKGKERRKQKKNRKRKYINEAIPGTTSVPKYKGIFVLKPNPNDAQVLGHCGII